MAGRTRRALVHAPADIEPGTARAARLHAPRVHAGRRELRRRDADERGRRPPRLRRRSTRSRSAARTPRAAGTGSAPSIRRAAPASRRRSPRSSASSWGRPRRWRSMLAASSWPGCPPAAPWPRSWRRPTRTCSPRSRCTRGSPTGRRPASRAAFAAMARGAGDPAARGRAAHAAMGDLARPVPSIVIHGSADPTVAPINGDQVLAQSMAANRLAAPRAVRVRHQPPDLDLAGQRRRRPRLHALPMDGPPRRPRCTSCSRSRDWATPGPAARPAAPTPTRAGPTRPRRSGASSQQVAQEC